MLGSDSVWKVWWAHWSSMLLSSIQKYCVIFYLPIFGQFIEHLPLSSNLPQSPGMPLLHDSPRSPEKLPAPLTDVIVLQILRDMSNMPPNGI